MAQELMVIKSKTGALEAATGIDIEALANWKAGKAYRIKAVKMSDRGLRFHRFYFAGLIELTSIYWEPSTGLIGANERRLLTDLVDFVRRMGADPTAIATVINEFVKEIKQERRGTVEIQHKSKSDLHEWIKMEIGFTYEISTPTGSIKKTKSINFNSMSEESFRAFYKKAFNLCWVHILSRNFENESQAENALNQLMALN